jgi:hypothetical protein
MAFWKMIKEGYDHFEVTHLEPKVDVCDKRYVFDAASPKGPASALRFSPTAACPAFEVPQEIATLVKEKQQRDEVQVAQLISRGTATVPVRTGTDGGMHPIFLAAVQAHGGTDSRIESKSLPGSIPANIRPPGAPTVEPTTGSTGGMSLASSESRPVPAPRSSAQVASAAPGSMFGGLFSSSDDGAKSSGDSQSGGVLSRVFGLHGNSEPADTASTPKAKPAAAKPTQTASTAAGAIRAKPSAPAQSPAASDVKSTDASATKSPPSTAPQAETAPTETVMLRGAQATVPAGSFDSRWSTMH